MNLNYEQIKLDKSMYLNSKKSFNQILEELDPTINYKGSDLEKLDAYQRQLKRFDIKVKGPNSNYVKNFYENSSSIVLFPEFLRRSIQKGIDNNAILKQIIATTTNIDTLNCYSVHLASEEEDPKNQLNAVKAGEDIPQTQIVLNQDAVKLVKHARMLTATYETIEFQKLEAFSIILEQIGRNICDTLIKDAIDVLIKGDTKKNMAPVIAASKEGEISYKDIVTVWTKFEKCDMDTMIVHPTNLAKIAQIDEFKNPLSKFAFPTSGNLATPLGVNIVKTSAAPEDSVIFLDHKFALLQTVAKTLSIDTDKLVDKQISKTVIYTIVGFSKLCKNASCVLKLKK